MNTLRITAIIGTLALCSCASQQNGHEETTPAETPTAQQQPQQQMPEQQVAEAQVKASDWKDWQEVTKQRFQSEAHGNMWVSIYVPEQFADQYISGREPVPQGMKVVMAQYMSQDADQPSNIVIMSKMQQGFDAEHSNWFYGVYDPQGTRAVQQGTLDNCIDCHSNAGTDYLYRNLGPGMQQPGA